MTDTFDVTGDVSPVESISIATETLAPVPNGFVTIGLAPELVQACTDLGYTQPTSVQSKVIPMALPAQGEGNAIQRYIDLMVSSQTGSGKTAAFLLPVLHTLLQEKAEAEAQERAEFEQSVADAAAKGEPAPKRPKRKDPTNVRNFKAPTPGALILCPTRELAQQVANDAIDLVRHCRGLRVASVVGGMPYQLQIAKLQNADLVVARQVACWTCSAPCKSNSTRFSSWWWTKPTACWTWVSQTIWLKSISSPSSAARP